MKASPARRQRPASNPPRTGKPAAAVAPAPGEPQLVHELGERLRAIREAKRMSLAQLEEASGVPGPTISRVENSRMSPTFGLLSRVMMGLDIDWIDLVRAGRAATGDRLLSVAEASVGHSTEIRDSQAQVLHSESTAHLLPLLVNISARRLEEVGGLIGHKGEEFCFVLSGTLVLHLEGQPPRILKAGASALFDSSIPHAYLSGTAAAARILVVVLRAYGSSRQLPPIA
jgi:transcriptional regulator with XRE-family HTH domain